MNSWAEISEAHLLANYRALRRAAGDDLPVLAVIKADAYGHGAELCAPVLTRAGAPWLGVTDAAEGIRIRGALRASGIPAERQPEILVMCGPAPEDAAAILGHRLTPVVWNPEQIASLERAAAATPSARLPVHLELDTGMSRQGAAGEPALGSVLRLLAASHHLQLSGVFTHLASAEIPGSPQTTHQIAEFERLLAAVRQYDLRPDWVHVGNTSTLDNPSLVPDATAPPLAWLRAAAATLGARPMVRSGLALYGYALPLEAPSAAHAAILHPHLAPVLTWRTRIRSMSAVDTGATIGYGATARAPHPMRLALLPVGYADGLRRSLSGTDTHPGGWVIVHGHRAPVVGRVSMNLTTVDVTNIPSAVLGDEVVLLGPGITADDHARLAGTIPYEILCGLGPDHRRLTPGAAPEPEVAHAITTPVAST